MYGVFLWLVQSSSRWNTIHSHRNYHVQLLSVRVGEFCHPAGRPDRDNQYNMRIVYWTVFEAWCPDPGFWVITCITQVVGVRLQSGRRRLFVCSELASPSANPRQWPSLSKRLKPKGLQSSSICSVALS